LVITRAVRFVTKIFHSSKTFNLFWLNVCYFNLQFSRCKKKSPIASFNGSMRNMFCTSLSLLYCSKLRGSAHGGGHQLLSVKALVRS
jgi:hypothetical protein